MISVGIWFPLSTNWSVVILNGLSRGMLIFLVASGLTLIYGLVGLINFAHGAMFTAGAYVLLAFMGVFDNFWLALVGGVIVVGLLGLALERTLLKSLYDREPLLGFLATFGIGLVIIELTSLIWGSQSYTMQAPISGSLKLTGVTFPLYRLFIIGIGAAVAILVGSLLRYTHFGISIYATTVDSDTAQLLGTNTTRIYSAVFFLGTVLAAFAGGLIMPITTVYPTLGLEYMLIAFLVITIGGMGSFKGAFITSILAGEIISLGSQLIQPTYAKIAVFAFAMVFLLVRPTGFYGKHKVLE